MNVSIIVPVYNGERTIARCIDSILGQTMRDLELIIIDDGSTDCTGKICTTYQDPRLRYHYKENGGVSTARNMGIQLAKGEYIGFVDADDYIVTDMCEKMYQACAVTNIDIAVCDYDIISNDNSKSYTDLLRGGYFNQKQIQDEVLPKFLGHTDEYGNIAKFDWAIIRRFFKRSFLMSNKLSFNEALSNSEDCLFAYLATYMAESMVYLKNERLYVNMRNSQSLTRQYLPDYWKQRCLLIDKLEIIVNKSCSAWNTESFPLFVMRCVKPSFTNIAYGFSEVSIFRSIKEFMDIVNDGRVRKMCQMMNIGGLNEEWRKLFIWCKNKRYLTLYLYYMDVQQGNQLCRFIRKIQKAVERRIKIYGKDKK